MGLLGRAWSWVKSKAGRAGGGWLGGSPRQSRVSALRPYLAGGAPGMWVSQHLEEAQRFTGFTYCAVSALCDQAAAAAVAVHHVHGGRKRAEASPGRRITKSAGAGGGESESSDRTPMTDKHPLVRLLNRPNPEQSGGALRSRIMLQLCITGTAHVLIIRNKLGVPVELYVIPTGAAAPLPPSHEYPKGAYRVSPLASFAGTVVDDFQPPGSLGPLLTAGGVVDARHVKSIRLPHPLYLSDGWSPLAAGALVVDVAEQLDRSRFYHFKNSAHPGMVLSLDEGANPSPEDMEALRQDLRNRNAGVANAGKDLLLPAGLKADQIQNTPEEMGYVGSFPQVRDAVLALHKTPAVAIGVAEAGSYSAFYASLMQFTELAVQPKLDMIAEELTEALGPPFERAQGVAEGERLVVALTAKTINDPSILENRIKTDVMAKAITINEVRALRGMPPVEWGDCPAGTDPLQWKKGLQELQNPQGQPGQEGGAPPGTGGPDEDPFADLFGPDEGGGDGTPEQPSEGDTGTPVPTRRGAPPPPGLAKRLRGGSIRLPLNGEVRRG